MTICSCLYDILWILYFLRPAWTLLLQMTDTLVGEYHEVHYVVCRGYWNMHSIQYIFLQVVASTVFSLLYVVSFFVTHCWPFGSFYRYHASSEFTVASEANDRYPSRLAKVTLSSTASIMLLLHLGTVVLVPIVIPLYKWSSTYMSLVLLLLVYVNPYEKE
ncbi:uncharacterized protein BYT42DRAFT_174923 [Radiomyces spectabilis]|uniref:uncharacterized protein n=1 Tax=Radiomyces spectabilis TaxID=64574 RepID=UPI002221057E|nr:uncharacterized protein BYT42DRAFT_174923 [Radiomyces spectabilis]KAI8390928.1 hypothetical protein BYT42DRAFT_174923 [Radiomyces spectabilis]